MDLMQLQKQVNHRIPARRKYQRERRQKGYRLARELGFSSEEASILANLSITTIEKLAQQRHKSA